MCKTVTTTRKAYIDPQKCVGCAYSTNYRRRNEMTRLEKIKQLNQYLLEDEPEYTADAKHFPNEESKQRLLLRSLMNVWLPKKELNPSYLKLQDELLQEELNEKGIVDLDSLLPSRKDSRLFVWKGDITRLRADAIVNAANSQMLGCFIPCHSCIDNAIHSAAGLQLREECSKIMSAQGYEEPTGSAKITKAYNLPAKYILHTVGPIIYDHVTEEEKSLLASCYYSCMKIADEYKLQSIAFCCISTGEFHFPNELAATIAVNTVSAYLKNHRTSSIHKIIFNVFKNLDKEIYSKLLL